VTVVPNTAGTRRLVDAMTRRPRAPSSSIRPSSVVDEAARRRHSERPIGRRGLDVFEPEPLPPDHVLWRRRTSHHVTRPP
jgi:phosphoglycerate dehydrogenase-like enzyme